MDYALNIIEDPSFTGIATGLEQVCDGHGKSRIGVLLSKKWIQASDSTCGPFENVSSVPAFLFVCALL
jgi:hypothetical protein